MHARGRGVWMTGVSVWLGGMHGQGGMHGGGACVAGGIHGHGGGGMCGRRDGHCSGQYAS